MYTNRLFDLRHEVEGLLWVDEINKAHVEG